MPVQMVSFQMDLYHSPPPPSPSLHPPPPTPPPTPPTRLTLRQPARQTSDISTRSTSLLSLYLSLDLLTEERLNVTFQGI